MQTVDRPMEIMNTELLANRPKPMGPDVATTSFVKGTDVQETIDALMNGHYILIEEFYSNGTALLRALHAHLTQVHPNGSYREQREFRSEYRRLSNQVLVQVSANELVVKKAPSIGWLEIFYPGAQDLLFTFPQIQGMNSAWQWYSKGVSVPQLRNKVHPYYGVYFPTRFEHLQLFDNWLAHYKGPKKTAIDVGIGCGVLSFLLMKHGFQRSFGTDVNPNAIIGLTEFMEGTKLSRKIELDHGDLFGKWKDRTELIVFNPPWLPASTALENLDEAIYYKDGLFPQFFEEAQKRLLPEGRLVLLFSNIGQITGETKEHPIEQELKDGGRFELDRCFKKAVKAASDKTKRDAYWRSSEVVELWALKLK